MNENLMEDSGLIRDLLKEIIDLTNKYEYLLKKQEDNEIGEDVIFNWAMPQKDAVLFKERVRVPYSLMCLLQPIKDAPKDRGVLIFLVDSILLEGEYYFGPDDMEDNDLRVDPDIKEGWIGWGTERPIEIENIYPTHWMRIPTLIEYVNTTLIEKV